MYSPNPLAQTYVIACPSHIQTQQIQGRRLLCCRILMGPEDVFLSTEKKVPGTLYK